MIALILPGVGLKTPHARCASGHGIYSENNLHLRLNPGNKPPEGNLFIVGKVSKLHTIVHSLTSGIDNGYRNDIGIAIHPGTQHIGS